VSNRPQYNRSSEFEVQLLESRVLLSADGLAGIVTDVDPTDEIFVPVEQVFFEQIESEDDSESQAFSVAEDFDELEDFEMQADSIQDVTAVWTNLQGGDWSDAVNWVEGVVPVAGNSINIPALNFGAEITFGSGVAEVSDLTSEAKINIIGGELTVSGTFDVAEVALSGDAIFNISGDYTFNSGELMTLTGSSQLNLEAGATLAINGGQVSAGFLSKINLNGGSLIQSSGVLEISALSQFNVAGGEYTADDGFLNFYDQSQFNLSSGQVTLSSVRAELFDAAILQISGGEFALDEGLLTSAAQIEQTGGLLTGTGTLVGDLNSSGTLNPGTATDATGQITIDGNYRHELGANLVIDASSTIDFDLLVINGDAVFVEGALELNLDANHTLLAGETFSPVQVAGVSVGEIPNVVKSNALTGFTVTWSDGGLSLLGVSLEDSVSREVRLGLDDLQNLLPQYGSVFNLSAINYAGQSLQPLTLPILPDALGDLFGLGTLFASIDLPDISINNSLGDLVTNLQSLGFTVDAVEGGSGMIPDTVGDVFLESSYTSTLLSDLVPDPAYLGDLFDNSSAGLLSGLSDSFNLNGLFDFAADVVLNVFFGVDASGFFLFAETGLVVDTTMSGELNGDATIGGIVGTTLSGLTNASIQVALNFNDAEDNYRLLDIDGELFNLIAPTASGSASVELQFTNAPVYFEYEVTYTLAVESAAHETSTTISNTLLGTLSLPEFEVALTGDAAAIELTGTYDSLLDQWNLNGSSVADLEMLGASLSSNAFSVSLSSDQFSGTGSVAVEFDFIRASGQPLDVDLDLLFNQSTLTINGSVDVNSATLLSSGGDDLLSLDGLSGEVDLSADFTSGVLSGTLDLRGTSGSLTPNSLYTVSLSDGDDADTDALTLTHQIGSDVFDIILDNVALVAASAFRLGVSGVAFSYDRAATTRQLIIEEADASVRLDFVSNPATGPPLLDGVTLSLFDDGFALSDVSVAIPELLEIGLSSQPVFQFSGVVGNIESYSVTLGESGPVIAGSISLEVGQAVLFPESSIGVTHEVTGLVVTYNFEAGADEGVTVEAEGLSLTFGNLLALTAEELSFRPNESEIVTIASISASLPGLNDLSATVTNLVISDDGAFTVGAVAIDAPSGIVDAIGLGGLLPFDVSSVEATFLGDENENRVRDAGETFSLTQFDLTVEGSFSADAFEAFPFTPIFRIGADAIENESETFSFTLTFEDGVVTPKDLGPIQIGVSDFNVGDIASFGGTITLGGYQDGEWVHDFGGMLTLELSGAISNITEGETEVSAGVEITVEGSLDIETGRLDVNLDTVLNFSFGDFVNVEGAGISLNLVVVADAENNYSTTLETLELSSLSVELFEIEFEDVISISATDAVLDLTASGEDLIVEFAQVGATFVPLNISGQAENFGITAGGNLVFNKDFKLALSLNAGDGDPNDEDGDGKVDAAVFGWPSWLPVSIDLLEVVWSDFSADPLDFQLALSATASGEALTGGNLTVAGSVTNAVIDVGALREGLFPIIALDGASFSIGGDIAGSQVSGALLVGIVRVDADGQLIEVGDTETEVAHRVFYAAVQGAIEIAGYGGFELYLGLSDFGPLQGYVKAIVPIPVGTVTGFAITGLRAGITFNSSIPVIEDAKEMRDFAEFQPASDLSFEEWQGLMFNSLETQVGTVVGGSPFDLLKNPFRIEGGASLVNLYASGAAFQLEGDFILDSTGKFLLRGDLELGGTFTMSARIFMDISEVIDGRITILSLVDFPSETPIVTFFGNLTIDFGVEIDPENPPVAPFEQFQIRFEGGADITVAGIGGFTLEGSVVIDVALNAPSLSVELEGTASIAQLGDLLGMSGVIDIFFDANDVAQAVGVLALQPTEFTALQSLGLSFDAIAVLRFNTTDSSIERELTLPGQSESRTFTLAAREAGFLIEGFVVFELEGIEWFRLNGTLSLTLNAEGFDVLVGADLIVGPSNSPWIERSVSGYMKFVVDGITPGIAAKISLIGDNDFLNPIGLQAEGAFTLILNTTGEDITYTLPTEFPDVAGERIITVARGPPSLLSEETTGAQPYLLIDAAGTLRIVDSFALEGAFSLLISPSRITVQYDALLDLTVGQTTLLVFDAEGSFEYNGAGLFGYSTTFAKRDASQVPLNLGFTIEATYQFEINTTGEAQELNGVSIVTGNYVRIVATGELTIGSLMELSGEFAIEFSEAALEIVAAGGVSLKLGAVSIFEFEFVGILFVDETGIYSELALQQDSDFNSPLGIGIREPTITLGINTTDTTRNGIQAGLGTRVRFDAIFVIGLLEFEGTFDFTPGVDAIGLGFDAVAHFKWIDNSIILSVPVSFEVTLDLPSIVVNQVIDVDTSAIGLAALGIDINGSFTIQINTSATEQNGVPAGPIARLAIDGVAIIQGFELDGVFYLAATIDGVKFAGDFNLTVKIADIDVYTFSASGGFLLTPFGVGGFVELAIAQPAAEGFDIFVSARFELAINTSNSEIDFVGRILEAGSYGYIAIEGELVVLDFVLDGRFVLSVDSTGAGLEADATLALALPDLTTGEQVTFFDFLAQGGLRLESTGILAALDLVPSSPAINDLGFEFLEAGASYALRVNTTGAEREINGITLEAGQYARLSIEGALRIAGIEIEGRFSIEIADNALEVNVYGSFFVGVPELTGAPALALFQFNVVGGLRIDTAGLILALDLEYALNNNSVDVFGISLRVGADESFKLRINTTGEARTINDIELVAGNYVRIDYAGLIDVVVGELSGEFSIFVGSTGLRIEVSAELVVGIPDTDIEFIKFVAGGGFEVTAKGVVAAIIMQKAYGPEDLQVFGLNFSGPDYSYTLRMNTTGEQQILGLVTLEAGNYIDIEISADLIIGDVITLQGLYHLRLGAEGLELNVFGTTRLDTPRAGEIDPVALYVFEVDGSLKISSSGVSARISLVERSDLTDSLKWFPISSGNPELIELRLNTTDTNVTLGGEELLAGTLQYVLKGSSDFMGLPFTGTFFFGFSDDYLVVQIVGEVVVGFDFSEVELFKFEVTGAFVIGSQGAAAQLDLVLLNDLPSFMPFEFNSEWSLLFNSFSTAVTIPGIVAGDVEIEPFSFDAGDLIRLRHEGLVNYFDVFVFDATFDFTIAPEEISLEIDGEMVVQLGNLELLDYDVLGDFTLDAEGMYGALVITLDVGFSGLPSGLGFSLQGRETLEINTTGMVKEINARSLEAGVYVRLLSEGLLRIGATELQGEHFFQLGSNGLEIHSVGVVRLEVANVTLMQVGYDGILAMESSGVFASLAVTVLNDGTADFGFELDGTFTLTINTTDIERGGTPAGLGAGVFVDGRLTVGALSFVGDFGFAATTTGIAVDFNAVAEFIVQGQTIIEVPVAIEFELNIPAIVVNEQLSIDTSGLGLGAFGIGLNANLFIQINTSAQEQGEVPAGPVARIQLDGVMTIGGYDFEGVFFLQSKLNGVEIFGDYIFSLRDFSDAEIFRFAGTGGFKFGLDGIGGLIELELLIDGSDALDIFGETTFELGINTGFSSLEIGNRILPEGPFVRVFASGEIDILGLVLEGNYGIELTSKGLNLFADAFLDIELPLPGGGVIEIFRFRVLGALSISDEGLAAAFDLERIPSLVNQFDFEFLRAEEDYSFRANTTGVEQTIGDTTLRADVYAEIEFRGTLVVGPFDLVGFFVLEVNAGKLEVWAVADLDIAIPALGDLPELVLFEFKLAGGFQIDGSGILGAIELIERRPQAQLEILGSEVAFNLGSASFMLELNSTDEARTIAAVELEAGPYFRIVIEGGSLEIFAFRTNGDFVLEVVDGGLSLDIDALTEVGTPALNGLPALTLYKYRLDGALLINAKGVIGAIELFEEIGPQDVPGYGSFRFDGPDRNYKLRVNTTSESATINGITLEAGVYADIRIEGDLVIGLLELQGLFFLRVGNQGLTLSADTSLSITLPGLGGAPDLELFNFSVVGDIEIDNTGLVAKFEISQNLDLSGLLPGVSFGGEKQFTLVLNTTGGQRTLESGQTVEADVFAQIAYSGSIAFFGLEASGDYSFTVLSDGVEVVSDVAFTFFDLSVSFTNKFAITSEGIVFSSALPLPNLNNPFFNLSGDYRLEVNTTSSERLGVAAGVAQIRVDDASLGLLGFNLSGSFFAGYEDGGFVIHISDSNPLTYDMLGIAELSLSGDLFSDGSFSFLGTGELDVGAQGILRARGDLAVTLDNDGLRGQSSGRLYILNRDHSSFAGSIVVDADGFDMTVELERQWLLSLGIISGTIEMSYRDELLSFSAAESSPLKFEAGGGVFEAEIFGNFDSSGAFDFTGSTAFGLGSASILRMALDAELSIRREFVEVDGENVSQDSASGSFTGQMTLLGIDQAAVNGSFDIDSNGFNLDVNVERIQLGLIASISGRVLMDFDRNALEFSFEVPDSSPITLELLGGLTSASIYGSFDETGQFSFTGTNTFALGSTSILRVDASSALTFNNSGVSGEFNGSLWVFGQIVSSANGAISFTAEEMKLSVENVGFNLLSGLVRLSGGIEMSYKTSAQRFDFRTADEAPLTLNIFGSFVTGTVTGAFDSDGTFDFKGQAGFALGSTSILRVDADIELNVSNDGASGDFDGSLWMFGQIASSIDGSMRIDSEGFDMSVNDARFSLLGGLATFSGGFNMTYEVVINRFSFEIPESTPFQFSTLGGLLTSEVSGYFDTTGNFSFTGSSLFRLGSTGLLRVDSTANWTISNDGIIATHLGNIQFFGTSSNIAGSITVDSSGFDLIIDDVSFTLLGGLAAFSGGFEMRFSTSNNRFSFTVDESNPLNVSFLGGAITGEASGYFRSDGNFSFNASMDFNLGLPGVLSVDANLQATISNSGASGSANSRLYLFNDYADSSGSFQLNDGFFDLQLDYVRILLGLVVIEGGLHLRYEDGAFIFSINNNAPLRFEMIGGTVTGELTGFFDPDGTYSFSGRTDFNIGVQGIIHAEAQIDLTVSSAGTYGNVEGRLYLPSDYANISGSFELTSRDTFNIDIRNILILLLPGVIVEGGLILDFDDGRFSFEIPSNRAWTVDVFDVVSGSIYGFMRADGFFDFDGTLSISVGNRSIFAFEGTIQINIRSDLGVRGWATGALYGMNGRYFGSDSNIYVSAGSGGLHFGVGVQFSVFDLKLSGTLDLSITSSGIYANTLLDVSLWGIKDRLRMSFDSRSGDWSISGYVNFSAGSSWIGARGSIDIYLSDDYDSVKIRGHAWAHARVWRWTVGGSVNYSGDISLSRGTFDALIDVGPRNVRLHARLKNGFRVWLSDVGQSTVFLDVNRNGRLDLNEPFTLAGDDGSFDFNEPAGDSIPLVEATPFERLDLNSNGLLDLDEARIRVSGGTFVDGGGDHAGILTLDANTLSGVSEIANGTIYIDTNLNETLDADEFSLTTDLDGFFDLLAILSDNTTASSEDVLGSFSVYDINNNAVLEAEEGEFVIFGGFLVGTTNVSNEVTTLLNGAPSGFTDFAGATIFFDRNGNRSIDDDELLAITGVDGSYSFLPPAEESETTNPLGILASLDSNNNGVLDANEGVLYGQGGSLRAFNEDLDLKPIAFLDLNGNEQHDANEVLIELELDDLAENAGIINRILHGESNVALGVWAPFDINNDGQLTGVELDRMITGSPEAAEFSFIGSAISGVLPLENATRVFADTNGNQRYDAGEIFVTPDSGGEYSFLVEPATENRLGRLEPFDTNGNGQIDANEGVFVIIGGTDNDNNIENPIAARALANNYGSGVQETINPLSSLHVSLVDLGLSPDDAEELLVMGLGLPQAVDLNTFDPLADELSDVAGAENTYLGVAAQITSMLAGASSLIGDSDDPDAQDAVLDALAAALLDQSQNNAGVMGMFSLDLKDAAILEEVIRDAAAAVGVTPDQEQITASAEIVAGINQTIDEVIEAGGNVVRDLAAIKAVSLTTVSDIIDDLADGDISVGEAVSQLSDENLDQLIEAVVLAPNEAPEISDVDDVRGEQGDVIDVVLNIGDSDTRVSELTVEAISLNTSVVDSDDLTISYEFGNWLLTITTDSAGSGAAEILVVASDGSVSSEVTFMVEILESSLEPVVVSEIPAQIQKTGETLFVDLNDFITDSDSDVVFSATDSKTTGVASLRIEDGRLIIDSSELLSGEVTIRVTATDGDNVVSTTLKLTVQPKVVISEVRVDEGRGVARFKVALLSESNIAFTVNYQTLEGTAIEGQDFENKAGALTFGAGETVKFVEVPLINNSLIEQPESFFLQLGDGLLDIGSGQSLTAVIEDSADISFLFSVSRTVLFEAEFRRNGSTYELLDEEDEDDENLEILVLSLNLEDLYKVNTSILARNFKVGDSLEFKDQPSLDEQTDLEALQNVRSIV
jgi:hypothetical protein